MKRLPDPLIGLPEYPFTRNYFERPDGLAMQYVDEGSGPPVLMVHGNPTWSFFYRRLINALAPNFRCLAPDHLGMGLSSRPRPDEYNFDLAARAADLAALADHWHISEPIHLVAHDWGGPIAMSWAVEHPDRVASVTIMNSGLRIPPKYHLPLKLALFRQFTPLGTFLAQRLNLFVDGTASFGVTTPLGQEARQGFTAPYRKSEDRLAVARFVADIPLSPAHPSYQYLKEIDRKAGDLLTAKPLALVWGLQDFVFNRTVFLDWQARFPQAKTLVLPEAGHYLMEDEPQQVTRFISQFISGIKP